jgi:hypothetical protein
MFLYRYLEICKGLFHSTAYCAILNVQHGKFLATAMSEV